MPIFFQLIIGTPDEMVKMLKNRQEVTGGFGTVLGFAHDWANPEATHRSWELFARYVIPEMNGTLTTMRDSAEFLHEHQKELMAKAGAAVMAKISENEKAAAAMKVTMAQAAQRAQGGEWRPNAPQEMSGEEQPAKS